MDHVEDSASTSSDPIYDWYDVFLSFRGPDTRYGFTDHLYRKLLDAAIPTFRDDDELEKGEPLKEQLERAINESSISIIVFSKDYASSSWCLNELERILEKKKLRRNHKVLPIFYHVDASHVRYQEKSYSESFNQHMKDGYVSLEKINAWKDALKEAANLGGFPLNKDGSETEFILKILAEVNKNLPNRKALDVPQHLLGMDDRVNWIDSWFTDISKGNNVLLVSGIGGIGKTTIAKYFFNKYFRDFAGSCFLARITATWDQNGFGVCGLQSQLLTDILNKETTIYNCDAGTEKIKSVLCNKKVLLVLDDVSETEQLDALLGQAQRFRPGSKILVTTRNMSLVKDFIIHPKVHIVEILCDEDSAELFSWHAFRQGHPPSEYKQLSKEILLRCDGLPLALVVLGSSLRKKLDTVYWEKQLQKWNEIANPTIQKVMKISYDSLEDDTVKNLFLHIALFFVGEEDHYVVEILDTCGLHATLGIQNLIDRCLITTTYDKKLMMHHVIQDMGREIVRQVSLYKPGKQSILWCNENSFSALRHDKGTEAVQSLILDGQEINKFKYEVSGLDATDANPDLITKLPDCGESIIDALANMVNLKLAKLNRVHITGSCHKFPKKLRWISWHGFPEEYVPMELPMENLVSLDLQHNMLKQVWKGYTELKSLKLLNLSYSLKLCQTPDFTGLLQLERLVLRGCSELVKVCNTIGMVKGLLVLDLGDCKSLRDLPNLPASLVRLDLSGCLHFAKFQLPRDQETFGWRRKLKFVSLSIDTGL